MAVTNFSDAPSTYSPPASPTSSAAAASPDTGGNVDYSSPFFAARLIVGGINGPSYPLWTSAASGQPFNAKGGKDDPLNGLNALSFVTEVVVDLNLSGIPQIRVTLSPPYEDAIKLLDSELVEFGKNYIQIQFGYSKGGPGGGALLSPVYEGLIKTPQISFGMDTQIVLPAQGVGGVACFGDLGAGKTYTDTRRKAINEICQRCGFRPEADYSQADKDPEVAAILDAPLNWTQAWRTDMFMLQLMMQQAHCYFRIVKSDENHQGVVEVIARSTFWATQTPEHILSMYHLTQSGVGASIWPLLSASTPTNAIWMPGVRKALLTEIDEKARVQKTMEITHETGKDPTSAPTNADVANKTNGAMQDLDPNGNVAAIQYPGDPASKDYANALKSAADNFKASAMGIQLDVETLGIPTLLPGAAVAVRGLGMRLDSPKNYGVFKVTHTLNSSGYTTTAHIVANTAAYLNADIAKKAAGVYPTADAPTGDSDSVTAQPKADKGINPTGGSF